MYFIRKTNEKENVEELRLGGEAVARTRYDAEKTYKGANKDIVIHCVDGGWNWFSTRPEYLAWKEQR